ncbi:precorrin-6x reductase [Chloroherpeton thalassium ATCC 35110]|uniref:Precorrin-6x reductase n=1 Tax=Chloroherpeton thalassium (strain ATCC 35110 / GB-78) TaxID=517418 RepID=B3QW11_CHLT3|nr:precorrin-6A reductase [Chloroherpeton thalassium]ACF14665.1 precorrin-6x reductase [Chloroherpeton thalassium ATCC 35110]
MILVFGGTTEGRRVAGILNGLGKRFIYSTKTQTNSLGYALAAHRFGALNERDMKAFCHEHRIRLIVDAAHPFASVLRETIARTGHELQIPILHFERDFKQAKSSRPESHPLVHFVDGFEKAIRCLCELSPKLVLATTGVQTITPLKPYWSKHKMLVRILPQTTSIEKARAQGFPSEQTLSMSPGRSIADELQLIATYGVDCLLSKESGASGFLPEKIEAALQAEIPIVILKRPSVPPSFKIVRHKQDFIDFFEQLYQES